MSEVHTVLDSCNLKELCHVDRQSHQQGGEDVHEDPAAPALDLPVVMRLTHSYVALHTNCYDQVDTGTHADSRWKIINI